MTTNSVNGRLQSANGCPSGPTSVYGPVMTTSCFRLLWAALFIFITTAVTTPVRAMTFAGPVLVCPDRGEAEPPTFGATGCEPVASIHLIDPQGRSLWVLGVLSADNEEVLMDQPVGLFISAKASSEVWFNGSYLGANGVPALAPEDEVVGRMDAVFFVPSSLWRSADPNVLALRMSSHRGFLKLRHPVHRIGFGAYREPARIILAAYVPALFCFGVLLAGGVYFAVAAATAEEKWSPGLLAVASLTAATQLVSEAMRGAVAYTYPLHDLRLLAILFSAAGTSLALFAYIARRAAPKFRGRLIGLVGVSVLTAVLLVGGFDPKTFFAFLTPLAAALLLSLWCAFHRVGSFERPYGHAAVLLVVIIIAFAQPTVFLDVNIYILTAVMLLFFFTAEARNLANERAGRIEMAQRAQKLEDALALAAKRDEPERIALKSGSTEYWTNTDDIVLCSGAGDYVDIKLRSEAQVLHSGTLAELEGSLPPNFLRVHRSHLVNTDWVSSLSRTSSGTGQLELRTGDKVPVSRRVMPQVRESLSEDLRAR